jgi:hypothetical protein
MYFIGREYFFPDKKIFNKKEKYVSKWRIFPYEREYFSKEIIFSKKRKINICLKLENISH